MASTLQEMLLTPAVAPQVVAATQALVDQELAGKSGISATGLKVAYKGITAFAPGYYQQIIETLLPGWVGALEPYWADFNATGRLGVRRLPCQAARGGLRGAAVGHRRCGARIGEADGRQAVQRGARRRDQAHRGGAAEPGRHGAEVRLSRSHRRPGPETGRAATHPYATGKVTGARHPATTTNNSSAPYAG